MAAETAIRAQHETLTANTVDTVTLGSNYVHAVVKLISATADDYSVTGI